MHNQMRQILITLLGAVILHAQTSTSIGSRTADALSVHDYSGATAVKPIPIRTILPATCTGGELFFLSTAVPSQILYACTSVNIWTQQGSIPIPITGTLWPFGFVDSAHGSAVPVGTAGKVQYNAFYIPSPGIILNSIKVDQLVGTGHNAWAIYDSSCNLVTTSQTLNAPGAGPRSYTFSGLSLYGGAYFVAYTSDQAADAVVMAKTGSEQEDVGNVGESAPNYASFAGSNASSVSAGNVVFPATCGTRNPALAGASQGPPAFAIR